MSQGPDSYNATYKGYCEWQEAEQARYDQILSEMETMPPEIALGMLMYFLANYQEQQVAWSSEEINYISDAQNWVSELQAAFSDQANDYSTGTFVPDNSDSVQQGIDAGDDLYNAAYTIANGNPNNPFYSISNNVLSQLGVIYPDNWNYDGDPPDYYGLEMYWGQEWHAAATGNSSYLNATNTAFSGLNSSFSGESSEAQSQNKLLQQNYQMYLGALQDVMKAWVDQSRFSNQAMQSASS